MRKRQNQEVQVEFNDPIYREWYNPFGHLRGKRKCCWKKSRPWERDKNMLKEATRIYLMLTKSY